MTTIGETLAAAKKFLGEKGVEEGEVSAEILLAHVLDRDRPYLYRENQQELTLNQQQRFQKLVERRGNLEPVAYLTGTKEFFGREFQVTPDVLIPRPDSEILVDRCLELLKEVAGTPRILDIGTGSGCLGISVALGDPRAKLVAIDISPAGLSVARGNAQRLGLGDRFTGLVGNCLQSVVDQPRFDLVLSNPPYIDPADPMVEEGVRRHEPGTALFTPPGDSTFFHRQIILQSSSRIRPGGWLVLEIGASQADRVAGEMRTRGFEPVRVHQDYAGIDRVVSAQAI